MMRSPLILPVVLIAALNSVAFGQDLLWQGRLVDESVAVVVNNLRGERATGLPVRGLPIMFNQWDSENPGYESRYFVLDDAGQVRRSVDWKGDFFNSFPRAGVAGWYLAAADSSLAKSSPQIVAVGGGLKFVRRWQIGRDRYAVRAGTQTFLFDGATGELSNLAPDVGFVEVVAGANGSIALTGMVSDGRIILRVYDQSRHLIYEELTRSYEEGLRHLNLNAGGTVVEYSRGHLVGRGEGMKFTDRVRRDLDHGVESAIAVPLLDGRLVARGLDLEVWVSGSETLIRRLAPDGSWRQVAHHGRRAYFAAALPGAKHILVFGRSPEATVEFYDSSGDLLSETTGMASPFAMSLRSQEILVLYSLGETAVFALRN